MNNTKKILLLILFLIIIGILFAFFSMKKDTTSSHDEVSAVTQSIMETEKSIQENTDSKILLQDDLAAISDDLSRLYSNLVNIQSEIQMKLNQTEMEDISEQDSANSTKAIPMISYAKPSTINEPFMRSKEKTLENIIHSAPCSNRLFLASQQIITTGLQVFGTFFHEEGL